MQHDLSGHCMTTAEAAVPQAWDALQEAVLAHAAAAPGHLARVLAADPEFALAHAVKGLMLMSLARRELLEAARDCLMRARASAALRPVTLRERHYIDALALWLAEKPRHAAQRLETALESHPQDVLALKLSHGLRFLLGDQAAMLASLQRAAPHFGDDHPLAGFVHGCHAFALEERGHYTEAERAGRHAVTLAPRDAWGRHAVAHVLEMTGRTEEGIAWLCNGRQWAHANNLRFHIVWHLALFRLERGETQEVLRLYDSEIRGEQSDDFRDIANGASLLARLAFAGVDVGTRWEELADKAQGRVEDGRLVFADLHYVLALLGADRQAGAQAIARSLVRDARVHSNLERREAARHGALAAHGLIAFGEGDHAEAARMLGEARAGLITVGGSHAQRDVFEQAYVEALMRSGEHDRAAHVLAERLDRRGGGNRYAVTRLAELGRGAEARTATLAVTATPLACIH